MKQKRDDTKKMNIDVSREIYEEFNEFVQREHGKTRGMTGPELEDAMKRHMRISESDRILSELELIRAELRDVQTELKRE